MNDICTHEGCTNDSIELTYPDIEIAPNQLAPPKKEYLCITHARNQSFCWGCEEFVGGLSIWENPRAQKTGICDDCWDEMLEELSINNEDDYDE